MVADDEHDEQLRQLFSRCRASRLRILIWSPPLVRYITAHIAPQQWEENGGAGKIRIDYANRSLVITQTAAVHQELHQWFEQLREAKAALIEIAGGTGTASIQ